MADMQVTTKTSILHEHYVPEATVIASLKLDVPNGATLSRAQLIGKDGENFLLLVTQEPMAESGKVVVL